MARESTANEVFDEVAKIFNVDVSTLTRETRINEDLDAGSMHKMILAGDMGAWTGKNVTYSQMNRCRTIGEIIDYVEANR